MAMASGGCGGRQRPEEAAAAAAQAALAAATETVTAEELEAAYEEEEVQAQVKLHDLQLERLRLAAFVQRFREQPPTVEDLAQRHEEELDELQAEVRRLREENADLALRPGHGASTELQVYGGPAGGLHSAGSLGAEASQAPARSRAKSAVEELNEEVCALRRRYLEHRRRQRRSSLQEWRLESCRGEAVHVVRQVRLQERRLEDSRSRVSATEARLAELRAALVQGQQEFEQEKIRIRELHREAIRLREACYLPTKLKRESGFLVKALDQGGGGRVQTRKHLRGVEACARLYEEVAAQAPSLLPLAGRARADMEAHFARYLQLEEAHTRSLRRLHSAITRAVCGQSERPRVGEFLGARRGAGSMLGCSAVAA